MKKTVLYSATAIAALALAGCSSSPAQPNQSTTEEQSNSSAEVITFGTEGTYAPFTFHDTESGDLVGYDVEVAQAVAAKLGAEAQFHEVKWDGIFAGLESGRYDVVANQVAITPEREEIYSFSAPYAVSNPVLIVPADDNSITSVDSVKGKKSAQSVTSNWAELARNAGAEVVPVDGFTEAVAALRDGRVDVTFNDNLAVLEYFATTGDDSVKVGAEVPEDKSRQGFAFLKDSELAPKFTQALEELKADGTLAKIGEKYFGTDISE